MGKSSFLVAFAQAAASRYGVVFLDPMGEGARDLRQVIAAAPDSRVRWISAAESPHGFNALDDPSQGTSPAASARRVASLVEALRRVRAGHYVEQSFWGPRIEEMLGRALAAAASLRGTMIDAHQLLEEAIEGRRPPAGAPSEVMALFERVRQRAEDAEGARRLLYEFTSSPDLVRLLCDRDRGLRTSDLVAPGRVTVVCGDASRVGESTVRRLFAALLAILWGELIARPRPVKTFLVLDEVQWFGHQTLGEMLRLGRRYNVHVVLGTQSLKALPPDLSDAVRTNVADWLLFRSAPDEAREFARSVPQLATEDLLALGRGEAVFLEGKGRSVQFVSIHAPSVLRRAAATPVLGPSPVLPEPFNAVEPAAPAAPVEAGALATGSADALHRVYLDEITKGEPPGNGEAAVRAAGGLLGRQGSIRRKGIDARGPYWDLDDAGRLWLEGYRARGRAGGSRSPGYRPTRP